MNYLQTIERLISGFSSAVHGAGGERSRTFVMQDKR